MSVGAVFIASVLIRLPACHESFWLDELHSAWAVWDGVDQVPSRAAAGNQTPFYFIGLWFWKQLVGESEFALRFSSVLAMSTAAAVLVVAVTRHTDRLSAGTIAGGFLAVDSNAIFFGTELRPYAMVVLCAAVATALFASVLRRLAASSDSHERRKETANQVANRTSLASASPYRGTVGTRWVWLVGVACIAALLQPTSAGAFMPLAAIACGAIVWRGAAVGERIAAVHWVLAAAVIIATGLALAQSAAADAWSARDNWKAFASSHDWRQMWTVWPWKPLVIWPAIAALGWALWRKHWTPGFRSAWPWLLVLAVAITMATWLAARGGWIPLWHRRYMISVLPLLAWVGGACWATVADAVVFLCRRRAALLLHSVVVATALVLLAWDQGTLANLAARDPVLVRRHEGWREAITWIAARRQPEDIVWVAAGLIESQELLRQSGEGALPPRRRDYLNYAVSGPYRLADSQPIGPIGRSLASKLQALTPNNTLPPNNASNHQTLTPNEALAPNKALAPNEALAPKATHTPENEGAMEPSRSVWLLARVPAGKLKVILQTIASRDASIRQAVQWKRIVSFGGVTVVEIEITGRSPDASAK